MKDADVLCGLLARTSRNSEPFQPSIGPSQQLRMAPMARPLSKEPRTNVRGSSVVHGSDVRVWLQNV